MEPLDERSARLTQLLREAHLLRRRALFTEAEARCRAALELAPDDVVALEMLGELLHDRGALAEAKACFERVLALAPGRPIAEKRLAQIALEEAERARARTDAELLLQQAESAQREARRSGALACLLSLVFPGLGQLYNREFVKGAILIACGILFWYGLGDAFEIFLLLAQLAPRGVVVDGFAAMLAVLGGCAYLYAILDAPGGAARNRAAGRDPLI